MGINAADRTSGFQLNHSRNIRDPSDLILVNPNGNPSSFNPPLFARGQRLSSGIDYFAILILRTVQMFAY